MMNSRELTISEIEKHKIIAIVRGQSCEDVLKIAEALYAGGIRLLEVTYRPESEEGLLLTSGTIRALVDRMPADFLVGAGTVLTERQVAMTAEAGGRYIISPNTDPAVIRKTRELGLVSIPGAMTPTECVLAQDAGADFVKLFPIGSLGASYLKAIAAPLSHVRFLAVGGVTPANMGEYFAAGAAGIGTGGDLILPKAVKAGKFEQLTERAKEYIAAAHA